MAGLCHDKCPPSPYPPSYKEGPCLAARRRNDIKNLSSRQGDGAAAFGRFLSGGNGRRLPLRGFAGEVFHRDAGQGLVQQHRQPDAGLLNLFMGDGAHGVLVVLAQILPLVPRVLRIDRVPGDAVAFDRPLVGGAPGPGRGFLLRDRAVQGPGQAADVQPVVHGILLHHVVPELVEGGGLPGAGTRHEPDLLAVAAGVPVVGAVQRLVQVAHEMDQVHERDLLLQPRGGGVFEDLGLVGDAVRHAIVVGAILLQAAGGGFVGNGDVDVMPGLGVGRALDEEGAGAVHGAALDGVGTEGDVVQPDAGPEERADFGLGGGVEAAFGDEGGGFMPGAGPGMRRAGGYQA